MAQFKLYFSEIESAKEASNSHLHGLTEKLESNCQCVQGDLNKVKINTVNLITGKFKAITHTGFQLD